MHQKWTQSMYQVWVSRGDGRPQAGPRFRELDDAIRYVDSQVQGSFAIKQPDGSFHKWPDGGAIVRAGAPVRARAPANRRRYARLKYEGPGELEILSAGRTVSTVPMTIQSVSPSGLGCALASGTVPPSGTDVNARFEDGQRHFEVRGRVAWSRGSEGDEPAVGVSLQLELAPASMRREYASWVVSKMRDPTPTPR